MNLVSAGTRLGPYEIVSPIGAGGMGEVYRARDTRLDRTVAIKLILGHVAADPEFRTRFEREARAISALDHPHICTLYDVGHENGTDFLVMQYLEGETLAERLARASQPASDPRTVSSGSGTTSVTTASRGPIPVDLVLRYAAEIASALDAAHRRGIVHRDLKPGNVMLTRSGTRLLDFGLAKLAAAPAVAGAFAEAGTRTIPLTGQGALLGTLHYMSPEQLEGRDVDARSDIFSFGGLLYEMLTGRRPFDAPSSAGTIAGIVGGDTPPLGQLADARTALPIVAHRALERLLHKCMARDPDARWQSAADLADELTWINEERLRAVPQPENAAIDTAPSVKSGRERWWMAATAVAATGAIAIGWWWYPRAVAPAAPVRFEIHEADGQPFTNGPAFLSLSPDGRQIAFVTGRVDDTGGVWVRSLDSVAARRLPGTEGAWNAFWSPDGRHIAFASSVLADASLRRVDVAGGQPQTLADRIIGRGAWSTQGVILFPAPGGALHRVPEAGGPATPVTELDGSRQENQHLWPVFLADGRRFIFLGRSSDPSKSALYLASLDAPGRTRLMDVQSSVEVAPGYLLYHRDGTLMAHPFDEKRGQLHGSPRAIAEGVQHNDGNGRGAFAASANGTLVYRRGELIGEGLTMTWYDRSGKVLGSLWDQGRYSVGRLSPEGARLAVSRRDPTTGNSDLWLVDLDRGIPTRLTSDTTDEENPVWSPDGARIIFSSNRSGTADLYERASSGLGGDQLLFQSADHKTPTGFSPDGKLLLFAQRSGSFESLWALPMTGERVPFRLFPDATSSDSAGTFSPDGRWVAYHSSDGGRQEVYVQPYPRSPASRKTRLSTNSGFWPVWSRDGRQVIYSTADFQYMSVDVDTTAGTLRAGLPQRLFEQHQAKLNHHFTFDPATGRFMLHTLSEAASASIPITVVLNWASDSR